MNLSWWLEYAAEESPHQIALIDGRNRSQQTYAQLRQRSEAIASALREKADIGPDSIVATLLPDDLWHTAIFYALLRLGAVFSGFNRSLGVAKFVMDARRSGVQTLIVGARYVEIARQIQQECGIRQIIVCDEPGTEAEFPNLRTWADSDATVRIVPRRDADIAAINYTGGTSGAAKGVIFTHRKLELSAQASVFYDRLRSHDVNLSCISLFHSGGIQDAVKWVIARATVLLMGGWEGAVAARLIRDYQPTWIYFWVPTMVRDLMRQPDWDALPLQGVRSILAGETVPPDLQAQLTQRGMHVSNSYGMTETMPVGILKPLVAHGDAPPLGSCGRPLSEICEVVLKDPDTGSRVTTSQVTGEVCVRGDVVTPGYHNDPERTAAALDAEGFLHTRDLAYFDDAGWYFLKGRTDDIINSGAEKLSLLEVEEALRRHPAVVDVACIGVAHQRFGEVPGAFVVADDALDESALAQLLDAHCQSTLERWKRPRLYAKLTEIPRTMPKRTKNMAALKSLVSGITLPDAEQVATLQRVRGNA